MQFDNGQSVVNFVAGSSFRALMHITLFRRQPLPFDVVSAEEALTVSRAGSFVKASESSNVKRRIEQSNNIAGT